jgi:hypothetical protein
VTAGNLQNPSDHYLLMDERVIPKRATGPAGAGGEMEDATLVRLARDGAREAFDTLLERHWDLLIALCRRTLGDDDLAHDAAQEATLQALLGLDRLRLAASFGPWLAGIGLNICRDWLRYRAGDAWSWEALRGGAVLREPVDWQPGPDARAEAADLLGAGAASGGRASPGTARGRAALLPGRPDVRRDGR